MPLHRNKAVYVAIGIKLDGLKDVLGMWIGGNESAKYWLGVLNEIKNRGVEDIMIISVDGLTGFVDAIGDFFIWLVEALPSIAVIAAAAATLVALFKRRRNKRKAKNAAGEDAK